MVTPRQRRHAGTTQPAHAPQWRPSGLYLGVGVVLATAGLAWLLFAPATPSSVEERVAQTPAVATAKAAVQASTTEALSAWPIQATVPVFHEAPMPRDTRPTYEGDDDRTPDLSSYVSRGDNPTAAQVIDRLHQAGIFTGLGAFNPPGTHPQLVGLAVPEGFVLPEGYMRHSQATDDGQVIEPILMFAPNHVVLDENRQPIALPANRVVPPELAPKGMPIRQIAIPAALHS